MNLSLAHDHLHYIDHVVVGIDDLQKGMGEIEEMTGVKPAYGGAHPDYGTHNALISLDNNTYLEVLAPNPEISMNLFQWLTNFKAMYLRRKLSSMHSLKPFLWAVGSQDLQMTAAQIKEIGLKLTKPEANSRKKPNGELLSWKGAFFAKGIKTDLPFFISWDEAASSPAKDSPKGCKLIDFMVSTPNSDDLNKIVDNLSLPVRITQARKVGVTFEFSSPKGNVRLSS